MEITIQFKLKRKRDTFIKPPSDHTFQCKIHLTLKRTLPLPIYIHRRANWRIATTTAGLLIALLPLDKVLLGELGVDSIHGEQVEALCAHGHDAHFRLDVEHALLAAGGPYRRAGIDVVVLEVVAFEGPFEGCGEDGLLG